jgi:2-polyprenyl-6-methoxyphenol hydroxylase-like FAD-dependent oxidoreductase
MSKTYDVAIVGYGPTGMTLAALLGQQGHEVLVLERYPGLYNLPRAASFDDEVMRTFQKLGIAAEVEPGTHVQLLYDWVNGEGETLGEVEYDDPTPMGWAQMYMMYQPDIEDALDACCRSLPNVEIRQGVTVESIAPDSGGVGVRGIDSGGDPVLARARWLVGADGGHGLVRAAVGSDHSTYNFEKDWLVCDFERTGSFDRVPDMRQVCDPKQPIAIIRLGPRHHRFSFMLGDDEDTAEATEPERVWQRVSEYITPDDAKLIRVANYLFRSRIADCWRDGRVVMAGDAVHEMPPFLGQGMCSGMRDAHNLAWKLDLIIRGFAQEALLDTYQLEREPHVRFITEKAIEIGLVQTTSDPARAQQRDEKMLAAREANQVPEKLHFPPLSDGIAATVSSPHGGELFVQGRVRVDGREGLFDDLVGPGPCVIARSGALSGLGPEQRHSWEELGGHLAVLSDGTAGANGEAAVEDIGGTYAAWFDAHGCDAVAVRPDWYLFGSAEGPAGLADLVERILAALGTAGGN